MNSENLKLQDIKLFTGDGEEMQKIALQPPRSFNTDYRDSLKAYQIVLGHALIEN